MKKELNKKDVLKAIQALDTIADKAFEIIITGGSAMMYSYKFPLGTIDVDVIIRKAELNEVDKYIKKTAKKLNLAPNWMNMWVSSFAHYLPNDYEKRLNIIFKGKKIIAKTIGKEDILILKCFAHRGKDVG
ncbi:MAG: DUF6036 family nucleotidyltransferase, partial [Bdellovibrionales bacterium]|nr:DUF6036 family nucleotidyltransferase [Bdellovibrionales bacterium]